MNLKIKSSSERRGALIVWAGIELLLGLPRAHAQLAESDALDAAPTGAPGRYRDSGAWVAVERWGPASDAGRREVLLARDGVRFRAEVGAHAVIQLAAGVEPTGLFAREGLRAPKLVSRRLNIYRVQGRDGEDGIAIAARLVGAAGLASAIPDLELRHRAARGGVFEIPPDDAHYSAQWYLKLLEIEGAWRLTSGDRKTKVAIVDTGCDLDHPDLAEAFVDGIDLVDADGDPSYTPGAKGNEHGTACAGIVGAIGNNAVGVAGVCPDCSMICIRLFRQHNELVPVSRDIEAFEHALDSGAAVVSNSWGFAEATPVPEPLRAIIESVMRDGRDGRGTAVVFAAGNENRELLDQEIGAIPGVLNVGAVNNFEEAAPFGNYGPSVDLSAPNATFTTDISGPEGEGPGEYTALFGGTSAACPVVAGAAALVLSASPQLSALDAAQVLVSTARPALYARADPAGHDPIYGHGILAPAVAVRRVLGLPDEPEPAPGSAPDAGANAADDDAGGCAVARVQEVASGGRRAAYGLALFGLFALRARRRRD